MKLRTLTIGLTLLTAGTVIGVSTQQFASAEISAGDRPVLVPIAPCRLVDTRPAPATVGPRASKLGAADTLAVTVQQPATPCTGLIPTDALSLALNVTAIGASELSFLTIWSGGDRPNSSSLNPAPGEPPTPNAVTVDLAADQTFQIYNNVGSLNLLVDVIGYYENHNHDDLYYTETEVDTNFVNKNDLPETYFAVVNAGNPGSITRSTPGVTLSHSGAPANYFLTFPRDITACFWSATLGGDGVLGNALPVFNDLGISATQGNGPGLFQVDPDEVAVAVYDPAGDLVISPFTLTVTCP